MPSVRVVRRTHVKLPDGMPSGPSRVQVGFPASAASASNIEKAVWNEFGTRGGASGGGWGGPVPERPFMRNAMQENAGEYRAALRSAAKAILTSANPEAAVRTALARLGAQAQGDIQQEITALDSPPNSPVTIARKGSSNPLIETGSMRAAVTWTVGD